MSGLTAGQDPAKACVDPKLRVSTLRMFKYPG